MRVSHVMCVLILLLGVPAQARADFIGSSLFRQGTLDFDLHVSSFQELCASTTNAPSSTTCSGSLAVGTPLRPATGFFSGTAIETGSTSGLMSLGSAVSLDVWRVNQSVFSGSDRYFANATSTSTITDTVSIGNTGAFTDGFLRLVFSLNGSVAGSVDFDTLDGFDPTTTIDPNGPFSFAFMSFTANGLSVKKAGAVYQVDIPLLFGVEQLLSLQLATEAGADMLVSEGYRITSDFSHTATLSDALILDSSHQLVSGATLASASGFGYGGLTTQPPAPVPEPATLSLVGAGVVAGAFKSRRSRSRSTR